MDIRIVNTCNNNCLYCLEQSLREEKKYIDLKSIENLLQNSDEQNLTFYWWNPLLHPDLIKIIQSAKKNNFENIWILSNTGSISEKYLDELISAGLNNFGIYFYSFQKNIHDIYSGNNLELTQLLKNITYISQKNIFCKIIIHVNNSNIDTLGRDIEILHSKFWITHFEFINYLIEDRAKKYEKLLQYKISQKADKIEMLFHSIKKLNLDVKFIRFNKEFFSHNTQFISQK